MASNDPKPSQRRKRIIDTNNAPSEPPKCLSSISEKQATSLSYSTEIESHTQDTITETEIDVDIPETWTRMKCDKKYKVVSLEIDDDESNKVKELFYQSMNHYSDQIVQIDRIQNPTYYKQYKIEKESMEDKHYDKEIERQLWHGTSVQHTSHGVTPLISICSKGFNRNYSGSSTGNVYGEGVYFAVNASVSAKYSIPDTNGIRFIFLCSVLTGEYTTGTKGIKIAPIKNIERQEWYDSVCDNTISPTMFIIFNDFQAYPTYLVIFRQHLITPWRQLSWWGPKQAPQAIISAPAIPQAPLLVTNITATSCQLKWRPPANNIDVLVEFYEVCYQVEGGYNWEICNNTEINCWCIVNNLAPETGYYFQVIAVSHKKARSEPLRTTTIVQTKSVEPPEMPQDSLIVTNITATSCQVEWKPPANNNEVLVEFYEVYYRVDGGYNWEICKNTEINCWCIVNNLAPETGYYFQVIAVYRDNVKSKPLKTKTIVWTESTPQKYISTTRAVKNKEELKTEQKSQEKLETEQNDEATADSGRTITDLNTKTNSRVEQLFDVAWFILSFLFGRKKSKLNGNDKATKSEEVGNQSNILSMMCLVFMIAFSILVVFLPLNLVLYKCHKIFALAKSFVNKILAIPGWLFKQTLKTRVWLIKIIIGKLLKKLNPALTSLNRALTSLTIAIKYLKQIQWSSFNNASEE